MHAQILLLKIIPQKPKALWPSEMKAIIEKKTDTYVITQIYFGSLDSK